MASVTVIGDGGWGTAFALAALENGHAVRIWGAFPEYVKQVAASRLNVKFLDGITIPDAVQYETDIMAAVEGADFIINATPTQHVRRVFGTLAEKGFGGGRIVSLSKGLENGTFLRASEVITALVAPRAVCALSGPSHAEEIARRLPASLVAASLDMPFAGEVQQAFSSDRLRIYSDGDIVGVEIAGALKNVVAIAAGICDGLELGDNAKAALVTRGIVEIARFGVVMGALPATFHGLSGIGDLVTTCYSGFGRNRGVGIRIARGETVEAILGSMEQVAEGVWTAKAVIPLAARLGVEMPICSQVHAILFEGQDPLSAVRTLMRRDPRQEKEAW